MSRSSVILRPYKEQFVFDQPSRVLVTSQYPCSQSDTAVEKQR